MIVPNFESFLKKYIGITNVIITLTALFFAVSLVRNAINISLLELVCALGIISASFAYALVDDGKGYWFYVMNSGKIFDTKEKQQALIDSPLHPIWIKCVQSPLYAALISLLFATIFSILAYVLFRPYINIFIFIYCGICLPWFLVKLSKYIAIGFVRSHLLLMKNSQSDRVVSTFSIKRLITVDLLFSLLINMCLVLPLARKPAFSVQQGYATPAFIIAFLILLLIVCAFMLFFSGKSRRSSFVGELLLKVVDQNFTSPSVNKSSFFNRSRSVRYSIYFIAVFLWSILLCILFSKLVPLLSFKLIYFTGLVPLLLMYIGERYHVLRRDFFTAQDMQRRLATLTP